MEFNVPVLSREGEEVWVVARVERRGRDTKVLRVEDSPFTRTLLRPWTQGAEVASASPDNREVSPPVASVAHLGWVFSEGSAQVEISLKH